MHNHPPTPGPPDTGPILFYDSTCGLCARAVRWLVRHDRRGVLRFAPLGGETFAALHADPGIDPASTLVLADADGLHVRSRGVLRALRALGGPWRLVAGVLGSVPAPVLDGAYRFVARRRRRWFGRADACAATERGANDRFLP